MGYVKGTGEKNYTRSDSDLLAFACSPVIGLFVGFRLLASDWLIYRLMTCSFALKPNDEMTC
jgi:hypothetical protein